MKIARSNPAASALVESIAKGFIQSSDGVTSPGMSCMPTRTSATTEKTSRAAISAASRNHWVCAESSIPT